MVSVFCQFERLTGLKVKGRERVFKNKSFSIGGSLLSINVHVDLLLVAGKAEVLIKNEGEIILSMNKIGKGCVFFLNCALENAYTQTYNYKHSDFYRVYGYVFDSVVKPIKLESKKCAVTYHKGTDDKTLVLITKFENTDEITFKISDGYSIRDTKNCSAANGVIKFFGNYCWPKLKK